MESEIILFAKQYIEDVIEICNLMLGGLGFSTKDELYKFRVKNRVGKFEYNGEINQFFFHGIGCRFWNNNIEIDWDFGFEDRWCGIDPWKLYSYIQNKKDSISKMAIIDELEQAVKRGEMIKRDDRYYFYKEVEANRNNC